MVTRIERDIGRNHIDGDHGESVTTLQLMMIRDAYLMLKKELRAINLFMSRPT